jgi:hypothetical protein
LEKRDAGCFDSAVAVAVRGVAGPARGVAACDIEAIVVAAFSVSLYVPLSCEYTFILYHAAMLIDNSEYIRL